MLNVNAIDMNNLSKSWKEKLIAQRKIKGTVMQII